MSYITDPPLDHPGRAGHDFNYAVWTAGTSVTLCNVPWNSDYRDIVNFTSDNALDTYLTNNSGPTVHIDNLTYAAAGRPVRISLPFNDAYRFNYLRVHNPAQPVGESGPRTFYYFIRDVRFVAPNTTELDIQLDVWQTFRSHVQFGNCYVERGHLGIANENQFNDYGREYLTVPEGFDIGGEYQISRSNVHTLTNGNDYAVLVTSTVSLEGDYGTTDNPNFNTARGSSFERLPHGAEMYYFPTRASFRTYLARVARHPWISQGIISVQVIPPVTGEIETQEVEYVWGNGSTGTLQKLDTGPGVSPEKITLAENWREGLLNGLPQRYRHLRKFLTYP